MKLYMHPVSMTSRPVRLFVAESGLGADEQLVDLMTGEHYKEPFSSINPNNLVPVLEDGDLRLTESSSILKYLAEKHESPAYPRDLKKRAKINELMDWFNTNFYRDWAYGFIYPQIFPHHVRPTPELQAGTIAWGKERSARWLSLLDKHWIGSNAPYLTGNQITIADYFGSGLVTLGDVIRVNFAPYPNVARWIGNMKNLKSWGPVNEVFNGLVDSVKDKKFETL
jgi:glutathione S-transferase